MTDRHEMPVSCKAVLLDPTMSEVLLTQYGPGHFGLPGGHVEPDEEPDGAMRRELDEELGLKDVELARRNFFMHHNGKLILGYMGIISKDTQVTVQVKELVGAVWKPVGDIASGEIIVRSYGKFILQCAGFSEDALTLFSVPAGQTGHQPPSV